MSDLRGVSNTAASPPEGPGLEHYLNAIKAFHAYAGMTLFAFARQEYSLRDTMIQNLIARSSTMLNGIGQLWQIDDYQDCWILHRCLMDRLFHLKHLAETNGFDSFEAWSFFQEANAQNRVCSDTEFSKLKDLTSFRLTSEQKTRYAGMSKSPPQWKRPKAEDIAKSLDMHFLYTLGYDYGSRHVHPMADDGIADFYSITKLKPAPDFLGQEAVLLNSIIVATMIVQEGLNASHFHWRAIVYNFLSEMRNFLEDGSRDHEATLVKLGLMVKQGVTFCGTPEASTI